VWSKDERFVEGIHIVGDIITKISANCVINLRFSLLFTCLSLWIIICVVITVFILRVFSVYDACICLLLFQCEFVYLQMYLYVYILYIMLPQYFCVYIF
jgi:hypothetical protein